MKLVDKKVEVGLKLIQEQKVVVNELPAKKAGLEISIQMQYKCLKILSTYGKERYKLEKQLRSLKLKLKTEFV